LDTHVFAIFWFGFGFIPRILIGICAVGIAYGAWKFANGLGGYISAPSQKGSLAE